jgi:hypothetical protein
MRRQAMLLKESLFLLSVVTVVMMALELGLLVLILDLFQVSNPKLPHF